jgi:hypothetical protein
MKIIVIKSKYLRIITADDEKSAFRSSVVAVQIKSEESHNT